MDPNSRILDQAGRNAGYKVPEDYFAGFRRKMIDRLPEKPQREAEKPSVWTRVKPYLYMAAMFAGIWGMMKMFHMITSSDLSLDNPPEAVVMAMADSDIPVWTSDRSEMYLLEDDMIGQYADIEDFKEDFNKL